VQGAGHLDVFCCRIDFIDRIYLGFIYMPEGKVIQKVIEGKNAQLLFQQIGPLRPYTFQVFNRAV
jgi:hypothetical protein